MELTSRLARFRTSVRLWPWTATAVLVVLSAQAAELPEPADREVDFREDLEPLFAKACHACHGPEKSEGGFRLDRKADALAGGSSGPAIRPGESAESRLVLYLVGEGKRMPPEGDPFTEDDIALVRAWIDQGAIWPDEEEE